ncbi:MAG: helix-turn-helix transcriptional regulator, partial [Flavobacteriales bacterium]|nr:helix-turn-helix transcriptional regulator [Flavobacteriales bacterium]
PSKDLFADFTLRELIIRILQTESKKIYTEKTKQLCSSHRLAFVVDYIRKHLHENISIKKLSDQACMSESNFHKVFKNEMGVSPIDFINEERIKLALSLLKDPSRKVNQIYLDCGFNSYSYFNRAFKKRIHMSPKAYQMQMNEHGMTA